MSGLDVERLRTLAEQATPGPWQADDRGHAIEISSIEYHVAQIDTSYDSHFDRDACERDGAYIVAADPSTVLALLDRLQTAEHNLTKAEQEIISLKQWEPETELREQIEAAWARAERAEDALRELAEAAKRLCDRIEADDDPAWDGENEYSALCAAIDAAAGRETQ